MTTVTGISHQNITQINPAPHGPCLVGNTTTCPFGQWYYNKQKCNTIGQIKEEALCSNVQPGICPKIGSEQPNGVFTTTNPPINTNQTSGPVQVNCQYDVDQFNTICDINTWQSSFPSQTTQLNNSIAKYYCSQDGMPNPNNICCIGEPTVNMCPLNTLPISPDLVDEQMTKCSRFTANDASGSFCRAWDATVTGDNKNGNSPSDIVKIQYCTTNPDSLDCLCINRSRSNDYKLLKGSYSFNDGCWYLPCQAPEQLKTSDINTLNCPTNICQSIIQNYMNTGPVNFENVNLATNCINNTNPTITPTPTPNPVTSFWDRYKVWIILGIVILIVIIIIIIIVAVSSRKKTPVPTDTDIVVTT
jgi:hypothetical protein